MYFSILNVRLYSITHFDDHCTWKHIRTKVRRQWRYLYLLVWTSLRLPFLFLVILEDSYSDVDEHQHIQVTNSSSYSNLHSTTLETFVRQLKLLNSQMTLFATVAFPFINLRKYSLRQNRKIQVTLGPSNVELRHTYQRHI